MPIFINIKSNTCPYSSSTIHIRKSYKPVHMFLGILLGIVHKMLERKNLRKIFECELFSHTLVVTTDVVFHLAYNFIGCDIYDPHSVMFVLDGPVQNRVKDSSGGGEHRYSI